MEAKDVLVKVHACGLCYHDVLVMQGVLRRGVKERVVLGHEISGTVAQVGDSVEGFKVGDPVASIFTEPCGYCDQCRRGMEQRCANGRGIGHRIDGGLAEFVKLMRTPWSPYRRHRPGRGQPIQLPHRSGLQCN